MLKRPYINNTIVELETLFESSLNSPEIIKEIHNELHFRKTNRATQLHKRIEEIINSTEKRIDHSTIVQNSKSSSAEIHIIKSEKSEPKLKSTSKVPFSLAPSEENINPSRISESTPYPGPDPILAAWLTLEVLTPQPLPNAQELGAINRQLIKLEDIPEPWREKRFCKKGKETAVYWMVYLGELNLLKAIESILKVFPDEKADERSAVNGNTTLAVLVLDTEGRLVEDKMFLSSFAWGYGLVRAGKLKELASFTVAEKDIKYKIGKMIRNQNEEGEILPVHISDIYKIVYWLIDELNLPKDEVTLPGIAIRVPQFSRYSDAPEPELLNSFFIDDVTQVRNSFREGNIGHALMSYIGVSNKCTKQDVVKNQSLLAETLAPERLPLARWPGRGRYPLFLMQQAAINHTVGELSNEGLVAVNGPPGTGKTTLLRDIVAKVVLDRSIAMAHFEKPENAFSHVTSIKTGNAFSHLYLLDDSLLGHEIVVASSNNKAVENISREIPSSSAIANDFEAPLKYFQAISDAVAANNKELINGVTWGLAAAVLGNTANKSAFIKSFWWDKQRGMSTYLSAITGGNVIDTEEETIDNHEENDIAEVIRLESPPKNEIEAFERWQVVRKEFLEKLKRVQVLRKKAQEIYIAVNKKLEAKERIEKISQEITSAKQELNTAEEKLNFARISYEKALDNERKAAEDRKSIELLQPGFFACFFRTSSYRQWHQCMISALNIVKEVREGLQKTSAIYEQAQSIFNSIKSTMVKKENEKAKLVQLYEVIMKSITEGQKLIGINFADESFWEQDDEKLQMQSPWIFKDFQDARDDLFYASFALHRAFIDSAAKYVRHNIRSAIEIMKGRELSGKQESARRSLWATLFMVVPVISTTFASTSRLFGKLGREQLGWLLIDEAGQATPQAALGALFRAKRAVVIGDPLQIEPVVTIPPKLINSIFSQFGVSSDEWAAPNVSAQILADRSSWFGTNINLDNGELWVGSPLRVHRRCEQPMFSISNYIAYNGLMVYGTQPEHSSIGAILGDSVWINVAGSANGKWSEDEGRIVLNILKQLIESGIEDPDIFFITPFRLVSYKLREMIRSDRWISERLPMNIWEWTNERVGTIHTFQGKEADTVVLVLGAPLESSSGARRWAGSIPNILNVAVTRAKRRIFVIGNHREWKNEGYFKYLASSIPVTNNNLKLM